MLEKLRYGFYVILHPFKGFWEIKRENKGNLKSAIVILLMCIVSQVLRGQLTGFLFNEYYPETVNTLLIIIQSSALFLLWCIANWCLTSLADGEGTLKQIMTVVGYCLIPLIFANIAILIFSNVFSFEEETFLIYIECFGLLWAGFLLFSATATVHQYSASKTIWIMLLTIVIMLVFVFIALLCVSLIQQFLSFIESVYSEIIYRI